MLTRADQKNRVRKGHLVLMVVGMFVATAGLVATSLRWNDEEAEGVSLACQNSPECMAAVEKEQQANSNASAAESAANMYQAKVNELSVQIASTERTIAESEARVRELNGQIEETEKKLNEEQEALAELLINMHFEGDTEPITILAGSSSISDLAEKQARAEVVKQQISATATKIKEAKKKLEDDKAQVEEMLAAQKQLREELSVAKAEQERLVTKYSNDMAAYEAMAQAALAEQREAELREIAAHPDLYQGGSFSGYNNYEWQDRCPQDNAQYSTRLNGMVIGGAVCQCTSYAGWKAWYSYGIQVAWGNAYNWDDYARALGYRVDHSPAPGVIGQSDDGYYGHVWWVESINGDGSVNITEYNNPYATCLYQTGGNTSYCGWAYNLYPSGEFGSRTMSAWQAARYNYIHLR